jgi:hypothetical protein
MWHNALARCARVINILLSLLWDESRGQRNDPNPSGMTNRPLFPVSG